MNWYLMVLKKYAVFEGRSRRKEYWMFALFSGIISIILSIIDVTAHTIYLGNIYSLIVLIPSLAVGVRRMHDTNRNGWFIIVPFYNLYLLCIDGDPGENQYGPNPKNENSFNNEALDSHLTN